MKELFAALSAAFGDIEGASKDRLNPAFKSKYADLSSVVDAIKPALVKQHLFFTQITHEAEGGVCVETVVMHKSGEQMSFGKLFVPASKQDAQGFGSALTYCRRYSLMSAFGVAPEDDDGNAAASSAPSHGSSNGAPPRPARQQPDPLTGPMKTRAEARVKYGDIVRDLHACGDPEMLSAFIQSESDVLSQFERELPQAWNGDGMELLGLRQEIANASARCEEAAA